MSAPELVTVTVQVVRDMRGDVACECCDYKFTYGKNGYKRTRCSFTYELLRSPRKVGYRCPLIKALQEADHASK